MKRILIGFVLAVVFSLSIGLSAFAANKPPQKGETLPAMNLPIPKSPGEKSYLGLSGEGSFKIPQIKAKVVIIEIFSMYCPYCQKDAPGVNELYSLIENDPELKKEIKLILIRCSSHKAPVNNKTCCSNNYNPKRQKYVRF